MRKTLFLFIPFLFLGLGCGISGNKTIRGNGDMKSDHRPVQSFDGIDVSGNLQVFVRQDSVFAVRVDADENLQDYIVTEEEDGILRIYTKNHVNLRSKQGIKIYVSGPALTRFLSSGICTITGQNRFHSTEPIAIKISGAGKTDLDVNTPLVTVDVSGATSLHLSGRTKDFKLESSGSSDVACMDLLAENTSVDISGAGTADVFASVTLDVEISGAAAVRYRGNPTIQKDISGAGHLRKIE